MSDPADIPGLESDQANLQLQGLAAAPVNPFNEGLQPVPIAVKQGILESNQGPCAALTFMHPAGEYSFLTMDPQELDMLVSQVMDLRKELEQAHLRHSLTNPAGGLVVPTPKVPGANGARLL